MLTGPARTVPDALTYWARRNPRQSAVVHGDERLSYQELADAVESAGTVLRAHGIVRGDRVVLVGHNGIPWVLAYLACLRIGAIVCPANNRLSPEQFDAQCATVGARLVLHDEPHRDLVAKVEDRQLVELAEFTAAAASRDGLDQYPGPGPEDDALVSFTSGTTGVPKGAVLTHRALHEGSRVFAEFLGTSTDDSTLVLVPLFHNTGFVDQFGQMLVVGGTTHLLTRFRTADAVEEFRARPVTFVTAVPSILRLLMVSDGADVVYGPARTVLFGGSPMPEAWSAELRNRWPQLRLVHGYGLTEFTSACSFLPPELIGSHGESVGRPAPGVRLRVVTDAGQDAAVGETGEVWAAGTTRMSRYWNQPVRTAEKLSGEWLRTGDCGYVDADGLLWLTGRVDDVINRGGEKVLPAPVESRIAALPEVAEAAVFGFADPILLKRVGVAVQLRPGRTLDEAAARERLLQQLPDYAVPERWLVYDQLPRTASGKADRRAIARDFEMTRKES